MWILWLPFVYMIHVILDMMIFKPSIEFQPPFEPLGNMNWHFFCIEDLGLTFSFLQVRLYVAMGKVYIGWSLIPPYSFATNEMEIRKQLFKKNLKACKHQNLLIYIFCSKSYLTKFLLIIEDLRTSVPCSWAIWQIICSCGNYSSKRA
jgi:hypothetical protein